jgi:hypothetical protein
MSCLSIIEERGKTVAVVLANPIFPLSQVDFSNRGSFEFEVFEDDADGLRGRIGTFNFYTLDGERPFWGRLKSMTKCQSTHPGLARLRHKPTLRCLVDVLPDPDVKH